MKYLSRAMRDEIADVLIQEHDACVKYRDKQSEHPRNGVSVRRCTAEMRIKSLRQMIAALSPRKLK